MVIGYNETVFYIIHNCNEILSTNHLWTMDIKIQYAKNIRYTWQYRTYITEKEVKQDDKGVKTHGQYLDYCRTAEDVVIGSQQRRLRSNVWRFETRSGRNSPDNQRELNKNHNEHVRQKCSRTRTNKTVCKLRPNNES